MNPQQQSYNRSLRWVPANNALGDDVPPYGLVELSGTATKGFTIVKPRADSCFAYVNGPVKIRAGEAGQVSSGGPVIIAATGTPANGETWGATKDSFLASKGKRGFLILQGGVSGKAFADRPTSGTDQVELIHVSSRTADAGGWPATLYVNNHDGTWSTGPTIRVAITPGGYDTFEVGDIWAERDGTVSAPRTVTDGVTNKTTTVTSATANFTTDDIGGTITGSGIPGGTTITARGSSSSITISAAATLSASGVSLTITPPAFPLFFAPGNVKKSIDDCDPATGAPGTREWSLPGPWNLGSFVPD